MHLLLIPALIGGLTLLYLRASEQEKFSNIVVSFFDLRNFRRFMREEGINKNGYAYLLVTASWLVLSCFLTYLLLRFVPGFYDNYGLLQGYGIAAGALFSLFWFKKMVIIITGYFSGYKEPMIESLMLWRFSVINMAIIILPICLFLNLRISDSTHFVITVLHNLFLLAGLITFSGLYALKIVQEFRQSMQINVSRYYLFLYFCTLEILPLVVLSGIFMGRI